MVNSFSREDAVNFLLKYYTVEVTYTDYLDRYTAEQPIRHDMAGEIAFLMATEQYDILIKSWIANAAVCDTCNKYTVELLDAPISEMALRINETCEECKFRHNCKSWPLKITCQDIVKWRLKVGK